MLKEVCLENFTNVPKVISLGANRIELNNDLMLGGTTPSYGVIKKTIDYASKYEVPVVVMIRPHGGNFVYTNDEIEIMANDLQLAAKLGASGVAFGCLTDNNHLNKVQMIKLIGLAKSLRIDVIMHMAFDALPANDQHSSLNWLAKQGVKRILTHGGSLDKAISADFAHLKELNSWARNQIEILPGGGINATNCQSVADHLGVNQLHGSKIIEFK